MKMASSLVASASLGLVPAGMEYGRNGRPFFDLVPSVPWLLIARDFSLATHVHITDVADTPISTLRHIIQFSRVSREAAALSGVKWWPGVQTYPVRFFQFCGIDRLAGLQGRPQLLQPALTLGSPSQVGTSQCPRPLNTLPAPFVGKLLSTSREHLTEQVPNREPAYLKGNYLKRGSPLMPRCRNSHVVVTVSRSRGMPFMSCRVFFPVARGATSDGKLFPLGVCDHFTGCLLDIGFGTRG